MRIVFGMALLLLASVAHAENCYLSQCHTDNDGTLWCTNHEIDCCELSCLECDADGSQCLPCNYEAIDAAHAIDETQPIAITVGPEVNRELKPVDEGGIGGHGARGDPFEFNSLYSDTYRWSSIVY